MSVLGTEQAAVILSNVKSPILSVRRGSSALLLDGLVVRPAAYYALRKVRASYSGAAIRLRKVSDNSEADIGFNSDGSLNTAAAAAHISGSTGKVVTWYDQSGNGNHLTQATAADQPDYDASVARFGNKPAIGFDRITATNGYALVAPDSPTLNFEGNMTAVLGIAFDAINIGREDIMQKGGNGSTAGEFSYWLASGGTGKVAVDRPFIEAGVGSTNAASGTVPNVLSFTINGTTVSHYKDGAANGTDTLAAGSASANGLQIGFGSFSTAQEDAMRGWFVELALWGQMADVDRQTVEDSIGPYYGVTIS